MAFIVVEARSPAGNQPAISRGGGIFSAVEGSGRTAAGRLVEQYLQLIAATSSSVQLEQRLPEITKGDVVVTEVKAPASGRSRFIRQYQQAPVDGYPACRRCDVAEA